MGLLVSLIIAFAIASIFSSGYRKNGSWGLLTIFFLIIFMAGVAGHYWIVPFGPTMKGVSYLPIVFFTLIVAFLFSVPQLHCRTASGPDQISEETKLSIVGISFFIWILFMAFLVAGLIGHYRQI